MTKTRTVTNVIHQNLNTTKVKIKKVAKPIRKKIQAKVKTLKPVKENSVAKS